MHRINNSHSDRIEIWQTSKFKPPCTMLCKKVVLLLGSKAIIFFGMLSMLLSISTWKSYKVVSNWHVNDDKHETPYYHTPLHLLFSALTAECDNASRILLFYYDYQIHRPCTSLDGRSILQRELHVHVALKSRSLTLCRRHK
jgi:hypothetical protein